MTNRILTVVLAVALIVASVPASAASADTAGPVRTGTVVHLPQAQRAQAGAAAKPSFFKTTKGKIAIAIVAVAVVAGIVIAKNSGSGGSGY